ncbi:hypothetical protein P7K49_016521 [Saguinus oedipus]|uniref:Uncharacterized protein n=1 Tax=Saguinus oedipus TaxID=9490 RepID=A0ABQ9VCS3_SAGOE|nr:hypothetical protein P7K49_016521 [Saguinus oedipus]
MKKLYFCLCTNGEEKLLVKMYRLILHLSLMNLQTLYNDNCFLKQVSKKLSRKAFLTSKHTSGCHCGYCDIQSL